MTDSPYGLEIKLVKVYDVPIERRPGLETCGPCPICKLAFPPLVEAASEYFDRGAATCSRCGYEADLWEVTLRYAIAVPSIPSALTSIGANWGHIVIELKTGELQTINLTNHGVPADARILFVSYTPQTIQGTEGGVTPLEWHGNSRMHRVVGTALRLYGIPIIGAGTLPRTGKVGIHFVWIRAEASQSWPYLLSAFESIASGDHTLAMVFAQSAVEISMMPTISRRLRRRAGAKRVDAFMKDGLVYSHALNVVLPYLCGEVGIRPMPDAVRGSLNKLREKRNAIIHEGVRSSDISFADATEGLTAAVFGFEFMQHAEPLLLPA